AKRSEQQTLGDTVVRLGAVHRDRALVTPEHRHARPVDPSGAQRTEEDQRGGPSGNRQRQAVSLADCALKAFGHVRSKLIDTRNHEFHVALGYLLCLLATLTGQSSLTIS